MSEFFAFYATRVDAPVNRTALKSKLKRLKVNALVEESPGWLYLCSPNKKAVGAAEVVLHYFDHEGSAWDFDVFLKGKRIGGGIFGTNGETGAEDQGFSGDLGATAKALGLDPKRLEKTFVANSKKFFALLKLDCMGAPENEVPKGVSFFDEL